MSVVFGFLRGWKYRVGSRRSWGHHSRPVASVMVVEMTDILFRQSGVMWCISQRVRGQ